MNHIPPYEVIVRVRWASRSILPLYIKYPNLVMVTTQFMDNFANTKSKGCPHTIDVPLLINLGIYAYTLITLTTLRLQNTVFFVNYLSLI